MAHFHRLKQLITTSVSIFSLCALFSSFPLNVHAADLPSHIVVSIDGPGGIIGNLITGTTYEYIQGGLRSDVKKVSWVSSDDLRTLAPQLSTKYLWLHGQLEPIGDNPNDALYQLTIFTPESSTSWTAEEINIADTTEVEAWINTTFEVMSVTPVDLGEYGDFLSSAIQPVPRRGSDPIGDIE